MPTNCLLSSYPLRWVYDTPAAHVFGVPFLIHFRTQKAVVFPTDLGIWWTCSTLISVLRVCVTHFCKVGAFHLICVTLKDCLFWDILIWLTWILFIACLQASLKQKAYGNHGKHLRGDNHRSGKRIATRIFRRVYRTSCSSSYDSSSRDIS